MLLRGKEGYENMLGHLFRNRFAVVGHIDDHMLLVVAESRKRDHTSFASTDRTGGIFQQVQDHLRNLVAIGIEDQIFGLDADIDTNVLLFDLAADQHHDPLEEFAHVEQFHLRRGNPGKATVRLDE